MSQELLVGCSFARRLIERAAARLPVDVRDRYREEWLSHYDECLGTLAKLRHAVGCSVASLAVGMIVAECQNNEEILEQIIIDLVDTLLSELPEGRRKAAELSDADQKEMTVLQHLEATLRDFRQQAVQAGCTPQSVQELARVLVTLNNDMDLASPWLRTWLALNPLLPRR